MLEQLLRRGFSAFLGQKMSQKSFKGFSNRICLASAAAVISIAVINGSVGSSGCDAAPMNKLPPKFAVKDAMVLEGLRPKAGEYERIDKIKLSLKENQEWLNDHAIHGTLNKESGIEVYEIYKSSNSDELLCIIKFGSSLNGYPGVVHGGITALMFDNSFGWLLLSSETPPAVTANLNINYRKPVMPNTYAVLKAKFVSNQDRKIFLAATIHDSSGVLLADCTALFIKIRYSGVVAMYVSKVLKFLKLQ